MTSPRSFELAVIGAGSAGMAAARRACDNGLSAIVFEARHVGGTCVNAGCVPKKLLVHASRIRDSVDESAGLGWSLGEAAFDWERLRDAVGREVAALSRRQAASLERAGVEIVKEQAWLDSPTIVTASDGRHVEAGRVMIATGARSAVPPIPGAGLALTSDDMFTLPVLPGRLGIVGGGYIAVEFACMMRRFGVEVTLFQSGSRLLDGFDAEIADLLLDAMRDRGIDVRPHARVAGIRQDGACRRLDLESGESSEAFDRVLLAVGRRPATSGLGLRSVGVELDRRDRILADEAGRTSVSSVLAAGDVVERTMLAPLAIRGARRFATAS